MYCFLKDFASPIATFVAASVAAYITYVVQSRQQAIASNKLRLDLFDRKYAIFLAAKDLLRLSLNECYEMEAVRRNTNAIIKFYRILDEGEFFLSRECCSYLRRCHDDCEAMFRAIGEKETTKEFTEELSEKIRQAVDALRADYAGLQQAFSPELRVSA